MMPICGTSPRVSGLPTGSPRMARRASVPAQAFITRRSRRAISTRIRMLRRSRVPSLFRMLAFEDPYGSKGMANPFPQNFGPKVPGPEFRFDPNNNIRAYFTRDYRIPQLITWSFRLERQFGNEWVASVAYLGNKGTFQQITLDENPAIFGPGATVGNTQERRVYPNFGRVSRTEAGGNTNFNSVQFNLEKRFAAGYSILYQLHVVPDD